MARKMYLLPFEQYERSIADRDEVKEKINTNERQMRNIMRSDLDESDKAELYRQALHHFLTYKAQKTGSTPAPPEEPKPEEVKAEPEEVKVEPKQVLSMKDIVDQLPRTYRTKAR